MKTSKIFLAIVATTAITILIGNLAIAKSNELLLKEPILAQKNEPEEANICTGKKETPETPETRQFILTKEVNFDRLFHTGVGDADVYTKNGNRTNVIVRTLDLNLQREHVFLTVEIRVKEGAPDHTELARVETIRIEAPDTYCIDSIISGRRHADYNQDFFGRDFEFHDISSASNIAGSYFSRLQIRFDGRGDDDQGNATLNGSLGIPVNLRPCSN